MLSKNKRLNKAKFKEILKKSKKIEGENFSYRVQFIKNGQEPRFSVVVSSKVSPKAVVRNKIRRQIYEILGKTALNGQISAIVYVKKEALKLDFRAMNKEISGVLGKI